jgi:hypothetical protein
MQRSKIGARGVGLYLRKSCVQITRQPESSVLSAEMSEQCRFFNSSENRKGYRYLQALLGNTKQESSMIHEPFQLPPPERFVRKRKSASVIKKIHTGLANTESLCGAIDFSCTKDVTQTTDSYDGL